MDVRSGLLHQGINTWKTLSEQGAEENTQNQQNWSNGSLEKIHSEKLQTGKFDKYD